MLITPVTVLAIIVAYLLGSIPTAVWVGKHFYKIDVRDYGSGNAGATNTFRVLGKKAGIPVLLIDVLKGWLAVMLVYVFTEPGQNSDELFHLQLRLGAASLIGHIFPIWAGFRGGKGVATLLGIIIALNLQALRFPQFHDCFPRFSGWRNVNHQILNTGNGDFFTAH